MNFYSQSSYSVRLEWGLNGVEQLAREVDCLVVVDVMSFSTCVSIAVDRGAAVFPYPSRDETAEQYAAKSGAAVAHSERRADGYSLSPSSLMSVPSGLELVLPSPNGSAIAYRARDSGPTVFCGCFRNMSATAAACARFCNVLVVACGERWPDGTMRPCIEDYAAAGGIISLLARTDRSPEARAATHAFHGFGADRANQLAMCASALELKERGFEADVTLCLEENVSTTACRLVDDRFIAQSC